MKNVTLAVRTETDQWMLNQKEFLQDGMVRANTSLKKGAS